MLSAVFNYRQRKAKTLYGAGSNPGAGASASGSTGEGGEERAETNGVRICVPLHRIEDYEMQPFAEVGFIATLRLNEDTTPPSSSTVSPLSSSSSLGTSANSPSNQPTERQQRELKLLVFKHENGPSFLPLIDQAKERRDKHLKAGLPPLEADYVTVDFGP